MAVVELRFAALPSHVRTARIVAASLARRCGLPAATVDEVRLAVGEACARAVTLHSRVAPREPVLLRFDDGDGCLCVEVTDSGPVSDTPAPGPDDLGIGEGDLQDGAFEDSAFEDSGFGIDGLGLALVTGLVDDVDVITGTTGVGTLIRMRWPTGAPRTLAGAES